MPSSGNTINFVYLSESEYSVLYPKNPDTLYFIDSVNERRIAIGDTMFANYVPAHCTAVSLNSSNLYIGQNEAFLLIATTEPDNPSDAIEWSASNNNVTITATGSNNRVIITGAAIGQSVVTCTCGQQSASCQVEIHQEWRYVEHVLVTNYKPNGSKFKYTAPISLTDGNYIEISIDVSEIRGTKENILGVGENIDTWSVANSGSHVQMYLTSSDKTKLSVDLVLNSKVRRPTYTISGTELIVRIDANGVMMNGSYFMFDTDLRATPTTTYEEAMPPFLNLSSYDIGSQEGSNRSTATYNYIKYYTTEVVT